jgi:hypothetical protein
MLCSVRTTSTVPAGIVTPNDLSTVRKARLAIPIQIKVCLFIYPNVREDVRLVYWTLGVCHLSMVQARAPDPPASM